MDREDGSVLSYVVILLLLMTLLGAGALTLAKQELILSGLDRQTANTYHLARSGAEKVVDTMNKEIAIELPRLMEKASKETQAYLLEEGLCYQYEEGDNPDPYLGRYIGTEYGNQYKINMKNLICNHIRDKFMGKSRVVSDYEAYGDIKNTIPILIAIQIYDHTSRNLPEDLVKTIKYLPADSFAVEVVARAKEGTKTTLAKSRVVATIALSEHLADDELQEEYTWGDWGSGDHLMDPADLQMDVFQVEHKWSFNNPIEVISQSKTIDLSQFEQIPTAIVSTNPNATISLEGNRVFNGIIITPGNLRIPGEMLINGWVVVGNEIVGDNIIINHDVDTLLDLSFMDKALQRKLYDSLRLTNYKEAAALAGMGVDKDQEIINLILGEKGNRRVKLSKRSVINSDQGGIQFVMKSLRRI